MPSTVQVGTILMKEWPGMPQLIGFETEPRLGSGAWSECRMHSLPIARSCCRMEFLFHGCGSQDDVLRVSEGAKGTELVEADSGQGEARALQWP
jgi:hypothetical protein